MITYRPPAFRAGGSGPAYDDTALVERLNVVERNRSVGDPVAAEIVSIIDIDETSRFEYFNIFGFDAQFYDGVSTTTVSAREFDLVVETFTAAVEGTELIVSLRDGRLVVTSSTGSMTVTTASTYDFEQLFPRPIPGYGIPILARPGVVYDTDATHVRAPESGLSPGSGESMETALRALHAADTRFASVVGPLLRIKIPDGVTSFDYAVTVADLGLTGRTFALSAYDLTGATPGSRTPIVTLSDGAATLLSVVESLRFDDGSISPSFLVESDGLGRRICLSYHPSGPNPALTGPNGAIALGGSAADVLGYPYAEGAMSLYSADQIRKVGGRHTVESYLTVLADEIRSLRARVAALEARP